MTVTDAISSEIMHKHDRLGDLTAKCGVTQQAFFAARECTLPAHTPLTCLPKRCVSIKNVEEVIAHATMKMSRCPLCDWPDKHTIRLTTLGESLVDAYLKVPNLTFHMTHKMCRQTSMYPTSRKVNCSKKHLPIGAICKHMVDHCVAIVTTLYCILFDTIIGALAVKKTLSMKPMMSSSIGSLILTILAYSLIFSPLGKFTLANG
jgi:hypothetical protein